VACSDSDAQTSAPAYVVVACSDSDAQTSAPAYVVVACSDSNAQTSAPAYGRFSIQLFLENPAKSSPATLFAGFQHKCRHQLN